MPEVNSRPAGAAPSLAAAFDGAAGQDSLGLLTVLRADQQRRWQAGQRVPAEDYLRQVPSLRDDPELAVDLIFSEFLLRRDVLHEGPSLDEYVARFPQHADVLRNQLELDALAPEGAPATGSNVPADRPRDAGTMVRAMTAQLADVQGRLREVEVERGAAVARVAAEGRARRRTRALAVGLLLALVGGAAAFWYERQQEAKARAEAAQRKGVERDLAETLEALGAWDASAAEAALRRAEGQVADGGSSDLALRVREMRHQLQLAREADRILLGASAGPDGKPRLTWAAGAYADLFKRQKWGAEGEDAAAVAARLQALPARAQLAAAVDLWAAMTDKPGERDWLLSVARRADPGEWGARFRDPKVREDPAALVRLAREVDVTETSPRLLLACGFALSHAKADPVPLLARAQAQYPNDFWLNFVLGGLLQKARPGEAVGYLRAAVSLRPQGGAAWEALGAALQRDGRPDEAIAAFDRALALEPRSAAACYDRALALRDKKDPDAAADWYRKAIEIDPDFALAHNNLGNYLLGKNDLDGAVAEYRRAMEADRTLALAPHNLGLALHDRKDLDGAIAAQRKAIENDGEFAQAHYALGLALRDRKDVGAAEAAFRDAVKYDRKNSDAYTELGVILRDRKDVDGAVAMFRQAVKYEYHPRHAAAHNYLGAILSERNDPNGAVAEFRRATELDPHFALGYKNLGATLARQKDLDGALAALEKAAELDPADVWPPLYLGTALHDRGRFADAAAALRRGLARLPERDPQRRPFAARLADCEQLLALEEKLPAILRGDARAGAADRLTLARVCQQHRRRYAASARLYGEAFAERPALAEDLGAGHRYNAACAAARAGTGQGEDAAGLPDKAAQALRRQALAWLRAELAAWRRLDGGSAADRSRGARAVRQWEADADLAAVRDYQGLCKLSEAERQEWRRLWDDVTARLAGTAAP